MLPNLKRKLAQLILGSETISPMSQLESDITRMRTEPERRQILDRESRKQHQCLQSLAKSGNRPSALPYNLTVSHEGMFIWFRVGKVCTRTIYRHLKKHFRLDVDQAFSIYYPPLLAANYFKFGFVRNPWDRLVSCWKNKVLKFNHFKLPPAEHEAVKKLDQFVEFVSGLDLEDCDNHLRLQCKLIDLNYVDFIGRFEQFDRDYQTVCRKLCIDVEDMVAHNVSNRSHYRDYYTDQLAERVYQLYEKDIRLFGYEY